MGLLTPKGAVSVMTPRPSTALLSGRPSKVGLPAEFTPFASRVIELRPLPFGGTSTIDT